jgi:hypothetical protein
VVVAKVLLHKPLSTSRAAGIDADGVISVSSDVVVYTAFVLLTCIEVTDIL